MASLKILSGSLSGQEIDLDFEPNFIGRASNNQVMIADAGVSSKHAKIWAEDGTWWVMDLGSTNGTLVNNADIDREKLRDGDKIAFGPIIAQFVGGGRRGREVSQPAARAYVPPPAPAPVARGRAAPVPAMPVGMPSGRESELELEISTLKARHATLEQEMERQRQEAYERERVIAEQAVSGMRAEMEKLRELMRERDQSMRTVESQSKERESWFSPEEVERERKRVEASVQLETRRQIEAFERQVRDLEAKVSARGAEVESVQRSLREKDDLIRMFSDREDRAGTTLKEREDKVAQLDEEQRRLKDDLLASQARERELDEKVKQKNLQLADFGRTQAELQQEISKARAQAARMTGGEAGAAAAELITELDTVKQQLIKSRAEANQFQDELITARSARDQEAARAQAIQAQLDEVQGLVTDLTDDKAKLEVRVEELVRKHSEAAEAERRVAGIQAELDALRGRDQGFQDRIRQLESQVAKLQTEQLDLISARDAALEKLQQVEVDYKVLRGTRDESFDWEARYKSQIEEMDSLRRKNNELLQTVDALEAGVVAGGAGGVDESQLVYARSRALILGDMAAGMLEGVNNAVSLMRRNSEVLKGYVHDCGLLANCVRQINYTRLEPDQQQMLRELIDETQPDVIIRNMESIGEENADATTRAKKLILDWQEAMKVDEEGTDLERCFAKSQGLFQSIEPGADIRVKVAKALPLPASQPEGVLFAFALLREAKKLAVDEDQMPTVRIDAEGSTVTIMVSPVSAAAKERYRETLGGGGDPVSQYVLGFARETCKGRIDVKDMGSASTMFLTLNS